MNKFSKWLVAIFTKIFDGFFEHVGDAIAVAVAVYFATLWGGRAANQEIKSVLENKQTDTVFVVNLHSDFAKAREYEIAGFQALAGAYSLISFAFISDIASRQTQLNASSPSFVHSTRYEASAGQTRFLEGSV